MRKHLHKIALILFALCFFFDLILWGAVPDLPGVGVHIVRSAHGEAILASLYIALGTPLDAFLPSLGTFGAGMMTDALESGFPRILEDPNLAMDLILSASLSRAQGWITTLYWAAPALFVMSGILWVFRPKTVSLIRKR